jgi:hypothetical protein
MEFDPSLDGLIGAVELSCDVGDGNVMMQDLFDGGALGGNGIMRLFFRHRGFWNGKGIVRDDSTIPLSEKIRPF